MATAPFDLHWSLTTPQADAKGKAITYKPAELPTLNLPDYFVITDSYVKLIAPVAGATTTLSEKTRSELREYTADGSAEQNWKATGGTHTIGAALVVKDLPEADDGKGGAFIGQIHVEDGKNPLLKFKCEDDGKGTRNLIVSFRADPNPETATANTTLIPGVAKDARIQYYAKVNSSGQLSAYFEVNGDRRTFSGDLSKWVAQNPNTEFYFKAGVYNDVASKASTPADDKSEAWFYKLTTTHS